MKYVTGLFFLILLLIESPSFSQSFLHPDFIETDFNYGMLVKNYPTFPERKSGVMIGSLHYGIKLNGTKSWHQYYHFPYFNLQFIYGSLGNKEVLGNVAGIIPEMSFCLYKSKNLDVISSLGLGSAWMNKPYNPENNTTNILIGSHITFLATASFGLEYKWSEKWSSILRLTTYHASNSHVKLPNAGANVIVGGLGVIYRPGGIKEIEKDQENINTDKSFRFNARAGYGIHQLGGTTDYRGDKHFGIYLLQLYMSHYYYPVAKYHIGFEAFYKESVFDTITSADFYSENQKIKSTSLLFMLGHELLMGHFSLLTQGGLYLYNPYARDRLKIDKGTDIRDTLKTIFTARLGVNYYFRNAVIHSKNQLFAGIYIKTNFSGADFLETGLGYAF